MIPPFPEALADLLAKYFDVESVDSLISAMEIALHGLYDDAKFAASEPRRDRQ